MNSTAPGPSLQGGGETWNSKVLLQSDLPNT